MESLSDKSDVQVLGSTGNNSSKTVLHTLQLVKIKSRETPKQGIRVIQFTNNKCIEKLRMNLGQTRINA